MGKKTILLLICGFLVTLLTASAFAIIDKIEAPKAGEDFDHAVNIEDSGYYFIASDLPTKLSSLFEEAYLGYYKFTPKETGEYSFYGKCIVGYHDQFRVRVYDKYQEQIVGTGEGKSDIKESLYTVQLTAGYTYYIGYTVYSYNPEEIKADLAICTPTCHAIPGETGEKCEICGRIIEDTTGFSFQPKPTDKPVNREKVVTLEPTEQPIIESTTINETNTVEAYGTLIYLNNTDFSVMSVGDFWGAAPEASPYADNFITVIFYGDEQDEDTFNSILEKSKDYFTVARTSWTNVPQKTTHLYSGTEDEIYHSLREEWNSLLEGETFYTCFPQISSDGTVELVVWFYLPDNPAIAGMQSIDIQINEKTVRIYMKLIYRGNYLSGNGWGVTFIGSEVL